MNRWRGPEKRAGPCMPHVCGDEPIEGGVGFSGTNVCPTYVGMNRVALTAACAAPRMPHVCGDEPNGKLYYLHSEAYAPRMWG